MTKIGCCLLLLADGADPLARDMVPLLAQGGYDYAELSLARLLALDEAALDEYEGLFRRHALPVEVFNNAVPPGVVFVGPAASARDNAAYIARALELARRFGVWLITVAGPARRALPPGFDWEAGAGEYAAFLAQFAAAARPHGIAIALEPANDEEGMFLSTLAQAGEIARATGCENVRVMVDLYHFAKQNDDRDTLRALCAAGDLAHIHFAEPAGRGFPLPARAAAYRAQLGELVAGGYRGRISIEAFTSNPAEDLPRGCALLRSLL